MSWLKPCPICGTEATFNRDVGNLRAVVACTNLKCRCKVERMGVNTTQKRVDRDAIKAWNAPRVPPPKKPKVGKWLSTKYPVDLLLSVHKQHTK